MLVGMRGRKEKEKEKEEEYEYINEGKIRKGGIKGGESERR